MGNGIHHFETQISIVFDHLYANSDFKTPTAIAHEVQKLLHVGLYLERKSNPVSPAFHFSSIEKKDLLSGEQSARKSFSDDLQLAFQKMATATDLYSREDNLKLSDFDLAFSCAQLEGIWLSDPQRDIFGDTVELFRSYWSKSHGGQFFTDSRVTKLAITLLQFNPLAGEDLVDICAGTGGFLLAGLNHFLGMPGSLASKLKKRPLEKIFIGQDLDTNVIEAGNAAISARIGLPLRILQKGNSLLLRQDNGLSDKRITLGAHYCAATNPPFGTKITIKDPVILREFEVSLAGGNGKRFRPCPPDVLFTEQNLRLLKPGGRLTIVLPFQLLSGPQAVWFRRWLLSKARIKAVVDLPEDTFQPYTGTKTSLVLLQTKPDFSESSGNQKVFMACPRWIGHDRRGNPIYQPTIGGSYSDRILTDFPEIERAYEAYLSGENPNRISQNAYSLSEKVILESRDLRFDARFHRPTGNSRRSALSSGRQKTKTAKLHSLVERIFFPGRFKRNYIEKQDGAVPFLGGTNISQLMVLTEKWLSPDDPQVEQLRVKAGWLLITRSGSTGIVSSVPTAWDGYAISEHVIRIVPKPETIPGEYLLAFLRSDATQQVIRRGVFGSVIDEISPDHIGDLDVPLPNDKKQINEVVRLVRSAEESRQRAITSFQNATAILNR